MNNSIRRILSAALVLIALAAAGVWWLTRKPRVDYPGANVVLVTLDTLRRDRLGSYGYAAAQTPRLDTLAHEGVRFENVVATVPLTLPSHASLMTSMIPPQHGVRDNSLFDIPAEATMLAEVLQQAGYDTGAFVGAYVLHSRWGLSRGFDTYDDRFDFGGGEVTRGQVERRGDAVLEVALPWLKLPREAPFFAWVHLYDAHAPYEAPEPFGSRFPGSPYDAEVAYTDSLVGELLDTLEEVGAADNTIVVVTADHGEALGDHEEPGHGLFLYDSTILVPLIVRLPDGLAAGLEVPEQVRLIDVAPTLLGLTAIAQPESFGGESLAPFFGGGGEARPGYSETFFPRHHYGWQQLHALRADGYKYILAPRPELYLLEDDPGEQHDLVATEARLAARMRENIERLLEDSPVSGPARLSAEATQRLRALGYVGGAPAVLPEGELADPKDKIGLYRRLTEGQGMLQAARPAEAAALLAEVVDEDPGIVDAQFTLGNARFALRDFAGAIEAYEATIELNPEYDLALSNLGLARLRSGDEQGARADFEALLLLDPGSSSAHYQLGEMELAASKPAAALGHFTRALERNDEMAAPNFGAGVASLQMGDPAAAKRALERAAALAPGYPEVHYYLALIADGEGDAGGAETHYRTEVAGFPGHYRAWLNLSVLLAQDRRFPEAVAAVEKALEANPDFARAQVSLGRYLIALNDPARFEEAGAAAARGLELDPPPEVRALGHFVLADVYNRLGRPQEAQQQLTLARQAQQAIRR